MRISWSMWEQTSKKEKNLIKISLPKHIGVITLLARSLCWLSNSKFSLKNIMPFKILVKFKRYHFAILWGFSKYSVEELDDLRIYIDSKLVLKMRYFRSSWLALTQKN